MFVQNRKMRKHAHLALMVAVSVLFGCAGSPPTVNDRFDPVTGVTITFSNTPFVLYRDTPSQAAYARNIVHLGPILVNRSGNYQYYLWLGIWSTMQGASRSGNHDGFDSILLFVDGEPLLLDLSGQTPDAIGVSEPVYLKPVASSMDAYYQVTADQIRLLAEAKDIRMRTTGSTPKEFGLWDDQKAAKAELEIFLN